MAGNVNLRSNGYVTEVKPGMFVIDPNKPAIGPDPRYPQLMIRTANDKFEGCRVIIVQEHGKGQVPRETLQRLFQAILNAISHGSHQIREDGPSDEIEQKPLETTCLVLYPKSHGSWGRLKQPIEMIQGIVRGMNLTYTPTARL